MYTVDILYNPVANIKTHNPQKWETLVILQKALFRSKVHPILLIDCEHAVKSAAGIRCGCGFLADNIAGVGL